MFEGGWGYQNRNFQDLMSMGYHRRTNNIVFKLDLMGVGTQINGNESIRIMENFSTPPGAPV